MARSKRRSSGTGGPSAQRQRTGGAAAPAPATGEDETAPATGTAAPAPATDATAPAPAAGTPAAAPAPGGTTPASGRAAEEVEWYPGIRTPERGEVRYRMEIPCLCGRTTTLNHVNQCVAAMQHWAFTRVVYEDYEKAKSRVLKRKEMPGRVKILEEDFPPFRPPGPFRPYQYEEYKQFFGLAGPREQASAKETAGELVREEEARYWSDRTTHRAVVEAVIKKFGEGRVVPTEWLITSSVWELPRRAAKRGVVQFPPVWYPRDLYVAEAVKNAHKRLGLEFDIFRPSLLYAGGKDRGMATVTKVEGKAIGRPSPAFVKWALLEDARMRQEHQPVSAAPEESKAEEASEAGEESGDEGAEVEEEAEAEGVETEEKSGGEEEEAEEGSKADPPEDTEGVSEAGGSPGGAPLYWVSEKVRKDKDTATLIANLEKEAFAEERSRLALVALEMGAGVDSPAAAAGQEEQVIDLVEIGSDED